MDTVYMIVTRDRYRLPVCWGSTIRELSDRSGISERRLYSAMWDAQTNHRINSKYEIVHIPDEREE